MPSLRSVRTNYGESVLIDLDTFMSNCYTISMPKMGRPKMLARERQSDLIALRLTPAERRELEEAARSAKVTISKFIRLKLGLRGDK
jgi:hypothetical protein